MQNKSLNRLNRRSFLQGLGSGAIVVVTGEPSLAAASIAIPAVDEVTLQVIVDAATFGPFLPDVSLPGLRVERSSRNGSSRLAPRPLLAEFGLSLLASSKRGLETRHLLIDFGYSPETLANNIALLGINPSKIDAAVLSHGHLDHYGGVTGVFGALSDNSRTLPLIVGGEEAFCERVSMIGNPPPVFGMLDRTELARAGFEPRIAPAPVTVAGHAFTTGIIPLQGFESAAIPTQMRPGVGCDAAALSPDKQQETQLADDGEHELATCFHVKNLGLVVIASCSHRGVLNTVRRAQDVSGIEKIHAVVGGFHLVRPRTEEDARRTVAEFVEIDPAYIVPMHCTGEAFIAEALRLMPKKIIRPYVGDKFVFGAG